MKLALANGRRIVAAYFLRFPGRLRYGSRQIIRRLVERLVTIAPSLVLLTRCGFDLPKAWEATSSRLCETVQYEAGERARYVSCRTGADLLRSLGHTVTHMTVSRWLCELVADGGPCAAMASGIGEREGSAVSALGSSGSTGSVQSGSWVMRAIRGIKYR
jgi:hypothetical protein